MQRRFRCYTSIYIGIYMLSRTSCGWLMWKWMIFGNGCVCVCYVDDRRRSIFLFLPFPPPPPPRTLLALWLSNGCILHMKHINNDCGCRLRSITFCDMIIVAVSIVITTTSHTLAFAVKLRVIGIDNANDTNACLRFFYCLTHSTAHYVWTRA